MVRKNQAAASSITIAIVMVALAGCSPSADSGGSEGMSASQGADSSGDAGTDQSSRPDRLWPVTQSELDSALSSAFSKDYDDFEEETTYVWEPASLEESVTFQGQLGIEDGGSVAFAALVVAYVDYDWIFFDTLDVRAGGQTYELVSWESYEKRTDVENTVVSEIGAFNPGPSEDEAIAALLRDNSSKFRLSGSDGKVERAFTTEERQVIRNWFTAHRGLAEGLVP